jgi:DNA-directed RNA polymerase specialized sigma subunit
MGIYHAATRIERREIQADTIRQYRGRIAAVARALAKPSDWEGAEEVGAIGLLVALEQYEGPADDFWRFAVVFVRDEIRLWLDSDVYRALVQSSPPSVRS